jgi:hypothetical protein
MTESDIASVTIEYEEDGKQIVKVLDKKILTKTAWATIIFLFQELDRTTQEFGEPKVRLVRYRKVKGRYLPQGKFNISNGKQALLIADAILEWFKN